LRLVNEGLKPQKIRLCLNLKATKGKKKMEKQIVLYRKNKFGKFYICDFVSNIEFSNTNAFHLATVFNREKNKDDIDYLTKTFGFDYKIERFTNEKMEQSKNLNRFYLK